MVFYGLLLYCLIHMPSPKQLLMLLTSNKNSSNKEANTSCSESGLWEECVYFWKSPLHDGDKPNKRHTPDKRWRGPTENAWEGQIGAFISTGLRVWWRQIIELMHAALLWSVSQLVLLMPRSSLLFLFSLISASLYWASCTTLFVHLS